jgi:hypothetical protein
MFTSYYSFSNTNILYQHLSASSDFRVINGLRNTLPDFQFNFIRYIFPQDSRVLAVELDNSNLRTHFVKVRSSFGFTGHGESLFKKGSYSSICLTSALGILP